FVPIIRLAQSTIWFCRLQDYNEGRGSFKTSCAPEIFHRAAAFSESASYWYRVVSVSCSVSGRHLWRSLAGFSRGTFRKAQRVRPQGFVTKESRARIALAILDFRGC